MSYPYAPSLKKIGCLCNTISAYYFSNATTYKPSNLQIFLMKTTGQFKDSLNKPFPTKILEKTLKLSVNF